MGSNISLNRVTENSGFSSEFVSWFSHNAWNTNKFSITLSVQPRYSQRRPFPRKLVCPEISFGTFYHFCFNNFDYFWCICTLFPHLQGYNHFKSHFSTRTSSLSVKVDILLESQLPKCQFVTIWRFIWSMVWKWQLIVLAISNRGRTTYGKNFCPLGNLL